MVCRPFPPLVVGGVPTTALVPCLGELPGAGLTAALTCEQVSSGFSPLPVSMGTAAEVVDPFGDWLEATAII
ncbi:MAG: hypothetical protein GY782_11185 [Gammaproteobacteria bacterium]|nr:hypothetical protein [Gammaproteobacteria bacterium]